MAMDANVLIYERLREELAAGKPLQVSLGRRLREGVQRDLRLKRHHPYHRR